MNKRWLSLGFWNTFEQFVTRIADALTVFCLIWFFPPDQLGELIWAQAFVVPVSLFLVSPELVIFRDYGKWAQKGELASRHKALRFFGWGKGVLSVVLSLVFSFILKNGNLESFSIFVWAFFVMLGPQIVGADKEFLRMELKIRPLNIGTLVQKLFTLGGTCWVGWRHSDRLEWLALVAMGGTLLAAGVFTGNAVTTLNKKSSSKRIPIFLTLKESIMSFSLWHHLNGVVQQWVQTMDLFFMGLIGVESRMLGIYGTAIKYAGLSLFAPSVAYTLFSVKVGRKSEPNLKTEKIEVRQWSFSLLGLYIVQAIVLYFLGSPVLRFFSRDRWSEQEITEIVSTLPGLLIAFTVLAVRFVPQQWLSLRSSIESLFKKVSLSWVFVSLFIYCIILFGFRITDLSALALVKTGVFSVLSVGLYFAYRSFVKAM